MKLFDKTTNTVAGMWFVTFLVPAILSLTSVPESTAGLLTMALFCATFVYTIAAIFKSI